MTKKTMSHHLRAALNHEQGLEESGYYKKRTVREMGSITFTIWLIAIIVLLALIMSRHHQQEENIQINRQEIMQRQELSVAQHAMNQELWIMKTAANSGAMMDQYHASSTRSK